jgi:shikimate kinase
VWLDVPFSVILDRVPLDGRRPLAADRQSLEQLYNQRLAAYRLAHVRVEASRGPVDQLVDQIVDALET